MTVFTKKRSTFIVPSLLFLLLAFSACSKKDPQPPSQPPPPTTATVSATECGGASVNATPTAGIAFNGTISLPYSGGNGKAYNAGTAIPSTGVSGLTATLQAGTLATGNGFLSFTLSGTASNAGIAVFTLAFGTHLCSFSIPVIENPNFVQYGTPFTGVPDRRDVMLYQVNMRAFSTTSNFQGVTARLDSIKALGINVIYLMPIFPVGQVNSVNSPYAVRNYRGINSEFGTLTDLRALVDGAHSKGMAVMLDWVANHTAWDNPWISQHPDWYMKNGSGQIISPPGTGWEG